MKKSVQILIAIAFVPVTGNPLILANSNNYYVYNAAADQWTKITSPPAALNASPDRAQAAMATGIPEYGVVFYLSPDKEKVYLYKHANISSNATAPAIHLSLVYGQSPVEVYDVRGRRAGVSSNGVNGNEIKPVGVYLVKTVSGVHCSLNKIAVFR